MDVNTESIVEEPVSSCSSQNDNNFGDPEILPRVGDQYQVNIPPLMIAHDDIKIQSNSQNCFNIGLPIPIMWVHNKDVNLKESAIKVDSNGNLAAGRVGSENSGYFLAPGSLGESWSESECASFLLGLYIFRKNFNLVKKFVENKEMGDILGYYYGKFYRSGEYIKWSESQKIRNKRFVHGERIFTGRRLQELLSRLFTLVSDECKNKLTEMSRTFGDGKLSLEDYVFSLKDAVGINKLVEAVAIGKGKKDLTGNDTSKSNNQIRTEVPSGKAWSSLTSSDIIKYLKGDFRLSKTKSYDLFWEAIWPRLLAREWHSEQPRDHIYSRSKNSLVFLVPGIKKFSRKKLSKGKDYFDSVTDVLNKVSSEPALIELESEEPNCGSDPRVVDNDPEKSNEKRHCYLQPRGSNGNQDSMKFTIVDTSLVNVREMRSLPNGELEENNVTSDRSLTAVNLKSQRKVKSLKSNYLVPVKKQRKLTACTNGESKHRIGKDSAETKLKQEEESFSSGTHLSFSCGTRTEENGVNGRRQSTRNRPLTTRALEALECEFLVTKKKRKGNDKGVLQNKSLSIYSRRVRAKGGDDTAHVRANTDDDVAGDGSVDL